MAADAAPSHLTQRGTGQSSSGAGSSSNTPAQLCTPEELYFHVVGRWPDGYGPAAPPASAELADSSSADREDEGGRKKRRKNGPRRTKASEIWGDNAEMAFCTAVACIPPNGRTKIKFFGRPLGRNELIAQICTLATGRCYNRKQISSHSQVLKDKVPPPYKEIFTFEDKSRGGDEASESATANVIENYQFPDAIYKVINVPLGEDLANKAKPDWLVRTEGGESLHVAEPTSAVGNPYNGYGSSAADYDFYRKDRDARMGSTSYDSGPYYPYAQPQRRQELPPYNTTLPPPMPMDPQSPLTPQTAASSESARRYGYSYPPPQSNGPFPSRLGGGSLWDGDHSRSPTTSSQFDAQSQSSAVSPRQPHGLGNAWNDTKPSLTSSGDHFPQLQDQGDWKWSMSSRGSNVPSLAPLTSLTNAVSQSSTFSLPVSPWSASSGGQGSGYMSQSWNGDSRETGRGRPTFTPSSIELTLRTQTTAAILSPPDLMTAEKISVADIYQCETRYAFLFSIPASANIPVFHVDVPVFLSADSAERRMLLMANPPGLHLRLSLRSSTDSVAGWTLTTDSAYSNNDASSTPFDRATLALRPTSAGENVVTAPLPELAQLYQNFARNDSGLSGSYDPLNFCVPLTSVVQRVVRDSQHHNRYNQMGSDWTDASTVIVYSFYVAPDSNARPVCRQVAFDVDNIPRSSLDPATSSSIVSDLLAGEGSDPSKFGFLTRP